MMSERELYEAEPLSRAELDDAIRHWAYEGMVKSDYMPRLLRMALNSVSAPRLNEIIREAITRCEEEIVGERMGEPSANAAAAFAELIRHIDNARRGVSGASGEKSGESGFTSGDLPHPDGLHSVVDQPRPEGQQR